jgi:hypothetical protein
MFSRRVELPGQSENGFGGAGNLWILAVGGFEVLGGASRRAAIGMLILKRILAVHDEGTQPTKDPKDADGR